MAVTAPTLEQVADYIADRTLVLDAPGGQTFAGTFTEGTVPTGGQALRLITEATNHVASALGAVVDPTLAAQATTIAAIRAAALIELSYPRRGSELGTYDRLIKLADDELTALYAQNLAITGSSGTQTLLPQWAFPDPPPYGDYTGYSAL